MNRYEKEEFYVDETQPVNEFEVFEAEDFKGFEIQKQSMESFEVEENQTRVQEQTSISNKKTDDSLLKKLRNNLSTTTSTSTTIGATGSIIVAGAVASTVILPPLFNMNDYGFLNFVNYVVETRVDYETEDLLVYKDLQINFEDELKQGFKCEVVNNSTKEKVAYDSTLKYIKFKDLTLDHYTFDINILNNNDIIDTKTINVNLKSSIDYIEEITYDYLLTYNDNDTTNFYFHPNFDNIDFNANKIITNLVVSDIDNNNLNYKVLGTQDYKLIENISEQSFDILANTYHVVDGNYYSINKTYFENIKPHKLDLQASLDSTTLQLNTNVIETESDVSITITYSETSSQEFIISKDEFNQNYGVLKLNLDNITSSFDINIQGNLSIYNDDENNFFENIKGSKYSQINHTETLYFDITSFATLKKVEVLNQTFNYSATSTTPFRIYFDGYINDGDTLTLNIYDEAQTLVYTQENIVDINEYISVGTVESNLVTFEYIVTDTQGNQISIDTYQIDFSDKDQYQYLDYTFNQLNPGDIFVTYNDDGTHNAYFYTNFTNNSEYELYYKINLYDEDEFVYEGKDQIALITNLSRSSLFATYSVFVDLGKHSYVIADKLYPSGSVEILQKTDGVYELTNYVYPYAEMTETDKVYNVTFDAYGEGSLELLISLDENEPFSTTVTLEHLSENQTISFELDLSQYTFTNASIQVSGNMSMQSVYRDSVMSALQDNFVGNIYLPAIVWVLI